MNDKLHRVIGIDLGTTYSAVATFNTYTEQSEILVDRDDHDAATTPSVIGVDRVLGKVIVGAEAKRNIAVDPENTVIEIKREMGEDFTPDTLAKYNAVGKDKPENPVRVPFAGQRLLPQELSAFILMKMKEIAEKQIGEEIRDAVITVPAYFTEKQKSATKEAALLAGLYPRQLIPEPTAAAICYGLDRGEAGRKVYLVYDLGGGTFDVSIIEVRGDEINVIATSGDPRLGGGDFDDAITQWAIDALRQQYQIDLSADRAARARIKAHAERAKIALSTVQQAEMPLVDVLPQQAPKLVLTREQLERLIGDWLDKSLSYVNKAIELAGKKGVQRSDIDAILLVGGSSQIPRVRQLLLQYFQKDDTFIKGELDPAAVVARGAAVLARRFQATPPPFDITRKEEATLLNPNVDPSELKLGLITEHSLGVGVNVDDVDRLIEAGTTIPVSNRKEDYTISLGQTQAKVPVYQGEGKKTFDHNTLIGTLHIGPFEARPAEPHRIAVEFALDVNGLLACTVTHLNTNNTWKSKFEQKTSVGGADILLVRRKMLLAMYARGGAIAPAVDPGMSVYVPPPPVAAPPAAAAPPQPPAPPAAPPAPPQPVTSNAAAAAIRAPAQDVPAQFKQVVRRAHKFLLKSESAPLLAAYNTFVDQLNRGASENDLIDAGDALAEVFDDVRA